MAPADGRPKDSWEGFEGVIPGLGVSDVIQLNLQNRFTGCLSIQSGESKGFLYFEEGGIVHVEYGDKAGEEALYDILEWPNGRFGLQPALASPRTTIRKPSQHLLLEAARILDERRAARITQHTPPLPKESGAKTLKSSEIIERVRAVPGVLFAVLQTKDGNRVGDQSFESEVLAGQGTFLAMVGTQLASVFQTGELLSATVEGKSRHLMLLGTKSLYLCVLVSGESQAGAVEAQVRQALAMPR
jgi:predicted regulator of Ras-like GTPase activity (Roadblock/LC7/MglB family)